jgi:hypothetical protein
MTGPRISCGAPPVVGAAVRVAGPLRRAAPVFAVRSCLCGGLALCSGAVTVTLGRVELGVVCEAAVPLRPHNNEADRIATVEGATRLDGIPITCTPKSGDKDRPGADTVPRIQPAVRSVGVMLRRSRMHLPRSRQSVRSSRAFAAAPCPGPATSLSPKRKTSITGSDRCISRISACALFEIFYVGPAGRYITLQNGMSLAAAVGYSGVYGKSGPHSRRRR